MRTSSNPKAFSLIEIVIALGVVSFAIISMFGLLSVGLSAGRTSLNQTVITEASRHVLSSLQQQTLSQVKIENSLASDLSAVTLETYKQIGEVYFDVNGTRLQDANGVDLGRSEALQNQAIYRCIVSAKLVDPQLSGTSGGAAVGSNLWTLKLTFDWPAHLTKPTNTVTILSSLAKYY